MIRIALLLATALIPAAATAQTPRATAATSAVPLVQLDHISIQSVGKGPPLVLIPGLACPRAVWDAFVPQLAKSHRVLLVQVNGFGGDAPGANLKPGVLDGIVADLHAYLAREKLRDVPVVGHSMGGLVAMMLAKAHADDVSKLMIVDSLPYFAVLMAPPGVDPTPAMVAPQAAVMRDRVAANYGKSLSPEAIEAQTRGLALKPASIALMKSWAAAADARVTGQAMYEDLTTDLRGDLSAIRTPITLVYPWNAAGPTKEMAGPFYRKQYAAAPAITYVDIGDAAHMVMLDQPAAFARALDDFLAK
ncbi:alpha/beta hydrolase [Sphingomonas donggukensis]|uniref:Alpha/beta hydrolase n=1 Tax=Sphingomonas donggukensis TaxID=2949093 RepID=A0ABY4TQQ6_9SPHN|nr:alpha/beta hydrolase [Sphingomonas donggukensis]URW74687.1 alpha/beta hydrolase [Sphingomonas donggukensis]